MTKFMRRTNSKFPTTCAIKTTDVTAEKRKGLAISFILQAKLLMRHLWTAKEQKLGWDDNITSHLRIKCFTFSNNYLECKRLLLNKIQFKQSLVTVHKKLLEHVSTHDGDCPLENMKDTLLQPKEEELYQLRGYFSCTWN